jgi:hypothetical protein
MIFVQKTNDKRMDHLFLDCRAYLEKLWDTEKKMHQELFLQEMKQYQLIPCNYTQ